MHRTSVEPITPEKVLCLVRDAVGGASRTEIAVRFGWNMVRLGRLLKRRSCTLEEVSDWLDAWNVEGPRLSLSIVGGVVRVQRVGPAIEPLSESA